MMGEHMAITSSDADRIWVIVTLVMHLLSLHAGPLSLTSIFFYTSVPFYLRLPLPGCSLPYVPPPPADKLLLIFQVQRECHFLLETFPGQLSHCLAEFLHPFWAPRAPITLP